MTKGISRRTFMAGAGLATGAGLLLPKGAAWAQSAKLPSSPVALNVIDAAGNLALTQPIFDNFASEQKALVSRFTFNKAPAPELPGKIKAQQRANRIDIDLVIIGPDALSAGLADDIWTDITRMLSMNTLQAAAGREMHLCPLQFDIVDRAITQYSEPGETVFDPFGGLMTVPYRALKLGRNGVASELNPGYFLDGCKYVEAMARQKDMPTLFDTLPEAAE